MSQLRPELQKFWSFHRTEIAVGHQTAECVPSRQWEAKGVVADGRS